MAAALVEVDHRRHAVVEPAIAELKFAGLAHVPSSLFSASAAALTVMAHNLGRAVGILAGPTCSAHREHLQRRLFCVPGRLVHSGRRLHLRLPGRWSWQTAFATALAAIAAIPIRC